LGWGFWVRDETVGIWRTHGAKRNQNANRASKFIIVLQIAVWVWEDNRIATDGKNGFGLLYFIHQHRRDTFQAYRCFLVSCLMAYVESEKGDPSPLLKINFVTCEYAFNNFQLIIFQNYSNDPGRKRPVHPPQ